MLFHLIEFFMRVFQFHALYYDGRVIVLFCIEFLRSFHRLPSKHSGADRVLAALGHYFASTLASFLLASVLTDQWPDAYLFITITGRAGPYICEL